MAETIVAQPWPNVGDVIPQAVQDTDGKVYIYPFRWQFGDRQVEGMGTAEYAIRQQFIAGALTEQEAEGAANNNGVANFSVVRIG